MEITKIDDGSVSLTGATTYNPCDGCEFNGPYWSIINPCENCPNYGWPKKISTYTYPTTINTTSTGFTSMCFNCSRAKTDACKTCLNNPLQDNYMPREPKSPSDAT